MIQDRLEQAIINVLETQAVMQNSIATTQNSIATMQNSNAHFQNQMTSLAERQLDSDRRWFEILKILNEHTQTLHELSTMLSKLPETIKGQIGFRA
jgi:hypothetical protein